MDNGAKRALIPIENKRNFLDVSADIMEHVDPIFYGDPKTAAMKVLGVEMMGAQIASASSSGGCMTDGKKPTARFSVDTHLFRELGELLVGRESTALIELVKNAYDADATEVTVFGDNLGDPKRGVIRIADDGIGMDPDTFRRGFLRVGFAAEGRMAIGSPFTSSVASPARRVLVRLAAHKLARRIEIVSIPWREAGDAVVGVEGVIDWDQVEAVETLDDVSVDAVSAAARPVKRGDQHGTTLKLSGLRQKWTNTQRTRFFLEVRGLQAPSTLVAALPKTVVATAGLFDKPRVADAPTGDPGFELKLEGDFEVGENYWPAVLETASWVLEIDASKRELRYAVLPTRRMLKEAPNAGHTRSPNLTLTWKLGPFFQARLLLREGSASGKRDERTCGPTRWPVCECTWRVSGSFPTERTLTTGCPLLATTHHVTGS